MLAASGKSKELPEVAPFRFGQYGANNVSLDRASAFEKTKNLIFGGNERNKFGHRFASLRDNDGFTSGFDLINELETACPECGS